MDLNLKEIKKEYGWQVADAIKKLDKKGYFTEIGIDLTGKGNDRRYPEKQVRQAEYAIIHPHGMALN